MRTSVHKCTEVRSSSTWLRGFEVDKDALGCLAAKWYEAIEGGALFGAAGNDNIIAPLFRGE